MMKLDDRFRIYRLFRFHAREVWSCPLPEAVAVSLQASNFETLKYMFSEVPPYVFTKRATPFLATQFLSWWNRNIDSEYVTIRNTIVPIIEAYPASYHHAATQEIGIGFSLNEEKKWPVWRFNVVGEYGSITHEGLTEAEVKARKKHCNGRPYGVPDEIWRKL
jgi:hypothetical protein